MFINSALLLNNKNNNKALIHATTRLDLKNNVRSEKCKAKTTYLS